MNRTTIAILLFAVAFTAKAQEFSPNEAFVSDFITSDRACDRQGTQCEHVKQLCTLLTPQRRVEIRQFIWNDYPYRAKNMQTNVMIRYQRALAKCDAA